MAGNSPFEYFEAFYDRRRSHSRLGSASGAARPEQQRHLQNLPLGRGQGPQELVRRVADQVGQPGEDSRPSDSSPAQRSTWQPSAAASIA